MRVLLIEDNDAIVKGLEYSFQTAGYSLTVAETYSNAVKLLKDAYELIILDVMLPDGNGFELYKKHISGTGIPVIFLTAKDDEDDVVKGFELGCEDYVTKPFSVKELFARINRVLSRRKKNSIVQVRDITFDLDRYEVKRDGRVLELSSLEMKLLYLLFENRNKAVSRSTMLEEIWEWTGNDVDDHTITVYLKRIREKLGTNIITTIKGVGYRIDVDEE